MIRSIRMLALVSALLAALIPFTASAHGDTHAGDYEIVVGFVDEPAYQGEPNGLSLRITNARTGQPVNDLAATLRAEIMYGNARRELELRPKRNEEGSYTAAVLPTEAGSYTFRIFGDIQGTPVDVSMAAGPDSFGEVKPKSAVAFPGADIMERQTAAGAAQTAQRALMIGVVGGLLGLAGLVVGLMGLQRHSAPRVQPAGQPRRAS